MFSVQWFTLTGRQTETEWQTVWIMMRQLVARIRIYTVCHSVFYFRLKPSFCINEHVQIQGRESPFQKLRDERVNDVFCSKRPPFDGDILARSVSTDLPDDSAEIRCSIRSSGHRSSAYNGIYNIFMHPKSNHANACPSMDLPVLCLLLLHQYSSCSSDRVQ